ncbi:MAG: envelope integrity protein Cei [Pseudonocardiaceae bacterium]
MGTVGSSSAQRSTWYRARKPLPAIAVLLMLAAVAGSVWVSVLNRPDPTEGGCRTATADVAASSVAPAQVDSGQRLAAHELDAVPPAPPQQVVVQVLNANGQRGEASIAAAELAELGFVPTAEPTNDPRHPAFDLRCHGEIRFGPAGEAAARTLSLAVPCAELVRDVRPHAVVDLALGSEFTNLRPNGAARQALHGLIRLGQPMLSTHGGQAAGVVTPAVDPALLREAREVDC